MCVMQKEMSFLENKLSKVSTFNQNLYTEMQSEPTTLFSSSQFNIL